MATVQQTQDLVTELGAPSIITPAQLRQAIGVFAPAVGKAIQEAGLLGQLGQSAELVEPDATMNTLIDSLFQNIGAMRRIGGDLEKSTRQLAACMTALIATAGQIKQRAAALGYITN